jgi:uncharacterized membrane protein YfcA
MTTAQIALGLGSGGLIGFLLGLVGGGGSILAVPLLLYVVGVPQPHLAIGTSAVAVAANAAIGLVAHARAGTVKWRCALVFALAGGAGALAGSTLGKMVEGRRLILLFALLMIVVAGLMLARRHEGGDPDARLSARNAPALVGLGLAAGGLSGFFGIGGGFLTVPALILATGMPMLHAVGTSLFAIAVFGAATAFNYARGGLVDWTLAATLIAGGLLGGAFGARAAGRLAARKGAFTTAFAGVIILTALAMLAREWTR